MENHRAHQQTRSQQRDQSRVLSSSLRRRLSSSGQIGHLLRDAHCVDAFALNSDQRNNRSEVKTRNRML